MIRLPPINRVWVGEDHGERFSLQAHGMAGTFRWLDMYKKRRAYFSYE
jgi:hypothetical protein